jgi:hypothetical protein
MVPVAPTHPCEQVPAAMAIHVVPSPRKPTSHVHVGEPVVSQKAPAPQKSPPQLLSVKQDPGFGPGQLEVVVHMPAPFVSSRSIHEAAPVQEPAPRRLLADRHAHEPIPVQVPAPIVPADCTHESTAVQAPAPIRPAESSHASLPMQEPAPIVPVESLHALAPLQEPAPIGPMAPSHAPVPMQVPAVLTTHAAPEPTPTPEAKR